MIFWEFPGLLRFNNPEDRKPWNEVRSATTFSKICPQAPYIASSMDEDCLYLNVYVPQRNISKPLAVMVWLHGGGNQVGNGMESYQGTSQFNQLFFEKDYY